MLKNYCSHSQFLKFSIQINSLYFLLMQVLSALVVDLLQTRQPVALRFAKYLMWSTQCSRITPAFAGYQCTMYHRIFLDRWRPSFFFYFSFLNPSKKANFLHIVVNIYKHHNINKTERDHIRNINSKLSEKNMTQAGRDRKNRINEKLFEDILTTKLICNLFVSVLPLLKEYVKVFQSGTPLIHKLHDKQFELIKSFLACFIKPDVFASNGNSAKQILKLNVEDKSNHLPNSTIFAGERVKGLISSEPKSQAEKIKTFFSKTVSANRHCSKKCPFAIFFLNYV